MFAQRSSAVYDLALVGMNLFSISFLMMGLNVFASGLFTALSRGGVSAFLSFMRTLVLLVACIWILPPLLDLDGLWLAVPLAEGLSAVLSIACIIIYRSRFFDFAAAEQPQH